MSVDTSSRLFTDYLDTLLARGDFAQFFTADVSWTTVETGEVLTGRQAVADYITALHTQVFEAHPEVRASGAAGEHAFLEADFVGTHTGRLGDLEPTGVEVRVPYCVIYDLTGDGISALRFHWSFATLLGQLEAGAPTQR